MGVEADLESSARAEDVGQIELGAERALRDLDRLRAERKLDLLVRCGSAWQVPPGWSLADATLDLLRPPRPFHPALSSDRRSEAPHGNQH